MARIRSSKPEWWRKPKWCALPRDVRFTYKGIWEVMCDDFGRFQADARLIKGDVWPLDDDITTKKVEAWLQQLAAVTVTLDDGHRGPSIVLYVVDGIRYGYMPGFVKHQKISHKTVSKFPAPPEEFAHHSGNDPEPPRIPPQRTDTDTELERDLDSGAEGHVSAPPAPLLSALAFPQGVLDFLGMFYEPALRETQRIRYRDVVAQLWDAVDPNHAGPKIKGGQRVKARDMDHLDFTCRRVMKDPPRERDKAIVFVLQRLLDPPPGPTPAERHKAETEAAVGAESAYQRASRATAVAWAKEHPDEYAPIVAAADREFPDHATNDFMRMAREAALTQRCARAAGFPEFTAWQKRTPEVA